MFCHTIYSFFHFQLTSSLKELCDGLKEMTSSTSSPGQEMDRSAGQVSVCAKLLLHCHPVLSVYCEVMENHVARSLALHRTLGKMLSVMLAVFTQLALKVGWTPAAVASHQIHFMMLRF